MTAAALDGLPQSRARLTVRQASVIGVSACLVQRNFELRKVELGTCGRPYGTPCAHEHACVRCPMLRVEPRQRGRLVEITRNLADRIDEARTNGWLGEVQGLQVSLDAARKKLASLDRLERNRYAAGPVDVGMPAIHGR